MSRKKITAIAGALLWLTGLATVFSFNIWSEFTPMDFIKPLQGKTIFGLIDYFGSNLIMPIGGILMAVLAGWLISTDNSKYELGIQNKSAYYWVWRVLVRYLAPIAVLIIFISNLA